MGFEDVQRRKLVREHFAPLVDDRSDGVDDAGCQVETVGGAPAACDALHAGETARFEFPRRDGEILARKTRRVREVLRAKRWASRERREGASAHARESCADKKGHSFLLLGRERAHHEQATPTE